MFDFSISIVTPVYNRKDKVISSLESSVVLVRNKFAKEIIVVDDASSDGSYECIREHFAQEITSGWIKIYKLPINLGVTGAKNFGAEKASGDYLAFMDSDDVFLDNAGPLINDVIECNKAADLFFFRCLDLTTGKEIGPKFEPRLVDLKHLITYGTPGECLPIVSREVFRKFPYEQKLRGCESLAYYRMLKAGHSAFISDKIVRGYCSDGLDRLSTKINIRRRAKFLLMYNIKIVRFAPYMGVKAISKLPFKIIKYLGLWLIDGGLKKIKVAK